MSLMQLTRSNSMSSCVWHSWQSSSNPSNHKTRIHISVNESPNLSNTDMSTNLSFRSRGGHLAHLEGVPQDQDMELNQLMALLHSESFFTPNHHVGRGIASYLHSRLTLAPLWDDSRKIEPRIFICSCVYWCCWNVSTSLGCRAKHNLK